MNLATAMGNLAAAMADLVDAAEQTDRDLNAKEFRREFEKAKACLRALYRDSSYASRSEWVNEVLDDPEVQGWIKELDG